MSEQRDPRNQWGDDLQKYLGRPRGMDLWSKHGTKVVLAQPEAGYDSNRELVRKHLVPWAEYTIERTDVGDSHTDVYLIEVPGVRFNSVHFINASDLPKATERALPIENKVHEHECPDWDFMLIDASMQEYEYCLCYRERQP